MSLTSRGFSFSARAPATATVQTKNKLPKVVAGGGSVADFKKIHHLNNGFGKPQTTEGGGSGGLYVFLRMINKWGGTCVCLHFGGMKKNPPNPPPDHLNP